MHDDKAIPLARFAELRQHIADDFELVGWRRGLEDRRDAREPRIDRQLAVRECEDAIGNLPGLALERCFGCVVSANHQPEPVQRGGLAELSPDRRGADRGSVHRTAQGIGRRIG